MYGMCRKEKNVPEMYSDVYSVILNFSIYVQIKCLNYKKALKN